MLPPAPARDAALSQIVVHGELPLATLGSSLEDRIQRRLADGRFGIGAAGRVSYSAERGALTLSVVGNQLVVRTPVHAHAEACRGASCYASCEPEAVVTAQVPLLLRPDYGFDRATVTLRFTRDCKVRALGGFLTVDVTPTLASALEPELANVARRIDEQLHNLHSDAEDVWRELSQPRALPLGGCVMLQPERLAQGPVPDSSSSLHARFALLARPELRTSCAAPSPLAPLPALERSLDMPDESRVMLGLVTPLRDLERGFATEKEITIEDRQVRASSSKITALGSDVLVELNLRGELCGELAFAATPSFAKDGAFIGLARPRWPVGERERLAARGFPPDPLLDSLAAVPQLPPLLSVTALRSAAPALAQMLSTPDLELSARVSSARGAGAAARGEQLVSWLEIRGHLDVRSARALSRSVR